MSLVAMIRCDCSPRQAALQSHRRRRTDFHARLYSAAPAAESCYSFGAKEANGYRSATTVRASVVGALRVEWQTHGSPHGASLRSLTVHSADELRAALRRISRDLWEQITQCA